MEIGKKMLLKLKLNQRSSDSEVILKLNQLTKSLHFIISMLYLEEQLQLEIDIATHERRTWMIKCHLQEIVSKTPAKSPVLFSHSSSCL